MKIWVVYFDLGNPGGVDTWIDNLRLGCEKLGHIMDISYATPVGNMKKVSRTDYTRMGGKIRGRDRLPADCIGYNTEDKIRDYVHRSECYDAVMFLNPSPHDIKSYNDPDMMWLRLYEDCPVPVIVTFPNGNWRVTNPWVINIAPYCAGILFHQHRYMTYAFEGSDAFPVQDYTYTAWDHMPIVFKDVVGLYNNEKLTNPRVGVSLAQWVRWKRHKELLEQLINSDGFRFEFYGGGIEYYNLRKTELWENVICTDEALGVMHNFNSMVYHKGYVPLSNVPGILKASSFAIDASTRGRENIAMVEPMAYGSVSIITEDIIESSPWQHLPVDGVVMAPADMLIDYAIDVANNFHLYQHEREAGLAYVLDNHTIEAKTHNLIGMLEMILHGDICHGVCLQDVIK